MNIVLLLLLIGLLLWGLVMLLLPSRPEPSLTPVTPVTPIAPVVPDAVSARMLEPMLAVRFAGRPADGSRVARDAEPKAVIWVDAGDEVIVHLDSLRTAIVEDALLVSIDLETDETGRQALVLPFVLGQEATGGVTCVTEAMPRGPEVLVHRWGEHVQQAAYAALLDLAATHAAERGGVPRALFVKGAALHFAARTGD